MKFLFRPRNRRLPLATLLCMMMAGGSLLQLSGAETKSKKGTNKSTSSATSKAKKTTPKSSKPSKTASASKSARTKKTGSSTASKTKKRTNTSAQKSRTEKKAPGVKPEAASGTPNPEIPAQPAPPLPQADPAASTEAASAAQSAAAGADGSVGAPMPVALSVAPPSDSPANGKGKPASVAPNVTLEPDDILGFEEQPPRVQQLITAALELTRRKLTYTYGSADPANGGMDCSGAIHYLLSQQGFQDVPRDASGQYVWARKTGAFFAVVSKKADSFEFGDLLPGDLLFWNGTYNTDRDPPVTHTMIYLGVQRKRAQHVMWGASDGRTYDSKPRWGVSVFDFKMPRVDKNILDGAKADFLGYARIPGLRGQR